MKIVLEKYFSGKPKEPTKEEIMASMKEKESKFRTQSQMLSTFNRFFIFI